ncbi:MAG: CoA transferase, partial [Acidimicrobiia bacterium]|nr:CoA transferase [Acidimicrobiia bacterium]
MSAPDDPHHHDRFLDGYRVLDFTQYLAGPTCTRLLTELGAEVIKVELAPFGDPTRAATPRRNKRAGYHVQQNRGKRSLCLDLRRPEARQLIIELIPHVDVVVENYSPGVMARRGLDFDTLSAINPGLVMASISGFGQHGSLSHKTSFDLIAQAVSGMMDVTGEPDGAPMFVGSGIADCTAGVHAFAGIGFALLRKERTGRGCHLDISMIDSLFHMHESNVHGPSMEPETFVARRGGRHHPTVCPAGAFRSPQGWIVILCTLNQMPYLWAAMGREDLAEDPRFVHNQARLDNLDSFVALVEEWMAGFGSDAEVIDVLERHRVPCGPVLNPADALSHPWFLERGTVRQVDDPLIGPLMVPGSPIRYIDEPPPPPLVAAALGEDNRAVARLAGYDDAASTRS